MRPPRILFLALEFETWDMGRQHSYAAGLGYEDGFAANGVEYFTLTTPCVRWAEEMCAGRTFDQVWLHALQSRLTESQRQWVASLAPIRVGLVTESIEYDADDLLMNPWVGRYENELRGWLKHLTHVVAYDEATVGWVQGLSTARVVWTPCSLPEKYIYRRPPPQPRCRAGVFSGNLYGKRKPFMERPELKAVLEWQPSSETGTFYPLLFNQLQGNLLRCLNRTWLPGRFRLARPILRAQAILRRAIFARFIRSLSLGSAVVNLPSYFKNYTSRVIEGMSAGRPVITWKIPQRPLCEALFTDEEDLLMFPQDDPEWLARQLRRVLNEPTLASRLAENARRKILAHHTTEHRVRQLLTWIRSGTVPTYF